MKLKKMISLALAGCLTLSLAACTPSADPAGSKQPENPSDAPSKSVETTQPTQNAEPKEIVYWSMWSSTEPQAIAIQEAADAYEAATGNTVTIEWKGRDISTFIQAALDAEEHIDIFDTAYNTIAQQYAGDVLDLEEMAAAIGYDDYAVAGMASAVRNWAGSLVCIPYQPNTSGVFYSKAAFAKAGIEKEPETWDEFLDVCQKLKDAGYTPLAQDDAYVRFTFGFQLARYIGQDAVSELAKNGNWAGTPEVLKAAQDIVTLRERGFLSPTAPDTYPDGQNELGFEKAAMVVNASFVLSEIVNNTGCDLEWGMFNYPTVEGGKDPATIANAGAQALAIPAYSQNAQEAFDFITMITTGEYDEKISQACNSMPADTRNTEWPEMLANCRDAFNALTGVYNWNMGLNDNADMKENIQDCCLKLFDGTYTAEQFVAAMDAPY